MHRLLAIVAIPKFALNIISSPILAFTRCRSPGTLMNVRKTLSTACMLVFYANRVCAKLYEIGPAWLEWNS